MMYIDDEFCKNLDQLKDYFNDCLSDNDVYMELLDSARGGRLSPFLRDLGEEQLADTVDSIDGGLCDSDYMSQLIATITGDKHRIEKPHYSKCFKIEEATCHEINSHTVVFIKIRILANVNEDFVVKIVGSSNVAEYVINPYKIDEITLTKEFELPDSLSNFYVFIEINGEKIKELYLEKLVIPVLNDVSLLMIYVKGGEFDMGSNDGCSDERPVHRVKLSGFYIGAMVVSQKLWTAIIGSNPSHFIHPDKPVDSICWDDPNDRNHSCKEFINRLNRITGFTFRLPTEAEWEYAARGGNKGVKKYKYAGHDSTKGICCNDYRKKTAIVNFGKPNELGLYGMTGNIWELCQDWYAPYCSETQTNPQGPESPLYEWHGRVCRGGSWNDYSWCISVSKRRVSIPTGYDNTLGVRLVLNVINQETCENDSLF